MPTTYADAECVRPLLDDVMRDHYPDLTEAGVSVGLYFAHAPKDEDGEPTGAALKLHGYAAAAIVKINALKERVQGKPDATIFLDGDQWPTTPDYRRRAIIDHELYHLVLATYPDGGEVKHDDIGRPRLKMRLHDIQLGGFAAIAKRHRDAALEVELARKCVQLLLPWGDDLAGKVIDEFEKVTELASSDGTVLSRKDESGRWRFQ